MALKAGWQQKLRPRLGNGCWLDPVLFLRSLRALAGPEGQGDPFHLWLEDLGTLAAVARRAKLHLRHGALVTRRAPADIQEARAALRQATSDCQSLFQCSERELPHA